MKSGKSKFDINLICLVASQFTILVIYLKLIMIALYSFSWLPLLLDKYFVHIVFFFTQTACNIGFVNSWSLQN